MDLMNNFAEHFTNKCILVTGANRGIGLDIAINLAKAGATVLGTSTSSAGTEIINNALRQYNPKCKGYVVDTSEISSMEKLIKDIHEDDYAIDILVNNAGIVKDNLILRAKEEDWEKVQSVNIKGPYFLSKLCLKDMLRKKWGRIINISSVVGLIGNPGQTMYSATKAALLGFTRSLAKELGKKNININTVAPGFIGTGMTDGMTAEQIELMLKQIPLGKIGTGNDIAYAVLFLCSPWSDYITGEIINVNGGMAMV